MQHFIINTATDKVLKVDNHRDFYADILTDLQNENKSDVLKRIDLKKEEKKINQHRLEHSPRPDQLEVWIGDTFPIMKASVYSDNKNVSFKYFAGTSTYKALEAIFDFCSQRYFTSILIFNNRTNKHVETTWEELKDDDDFARTRLGGMTSFNHSFYLPKTKKQIKVQTHHDFMRSCIEDFHNLKKLGLSEKEAELFYNRHLKGTPINKPREIEVVCEQLLIDFPIIRVTNFNNLSIGISFRNASIYDVDNFIFKYGEGKFQKNTDIVVEKIRKGVSSFTWQQYLSDEKDFKKLASIKTAGFQHYFINSRTGKEVKVVDHDTYSDKLRKNPKLFKELDLDPVFYNKQQLKYYETHDEGDYAWLLKIAPLIRLSYYGALVFEYSPTSNNKNDVADAVYNFCSNHGVKYFERIFVSTTTDRGIEKTWADFKNDYEAGEIRLAYKNLNKPS